MTLEFIEIGWQGASNVDCVTVWLFGANWNWTISPTAALTSFGANTKDPFADPTLTTCTVVIPVADPVDVDFAAEDVAVFDVDCAMAPAALKAQRASVVNCILTLKILISK